MYILQRNVSGRNDLGGCDHVMTATQLIHDRELGSALTWDPSSYRMYFEYLELVLARLRR